MMKLASAIALVIGFSFLSPWMMLAGAEEITPLILGGRDAFENEFPWFAAGEGELSDGVIVYTRNCGGTLIHSDIVLTAAHCVTTSSESPVSAFNNFVQIGGILSPRFYDDRAQLDGDIIDTVCWETYPGYTSTSNGDDIALVKLARPSVKPVVTLNFNLAIPTEKQTVTAIGNGNAGASDPEEKLQVLDTLYIQPAKTCGSYQVYYNESILLCTNDDNPSTTPCTGDSGGPIFIRSGGNVVQVGLLSYGIEGCDPVNPVYWTKIAPYKTFIENGICRLSEYPPANCPAALPAAPPECVLPPTAPSSPASTPIPPTSTGGMMKGMSGKGSGKGKGPSPPPYTPIPPTDTGGMSGKGSGGKGKGKGGKSGMAKSSKDPPKAPKMTKSMMGDSSVRNRHLK